MSALNYSKWDKIELSDDEDIEVHPNIDKASFIRWKQADIHRKREERKLKIAQHRQEHETNQGLLERIERMLSQVKTLPEKERKALVEKVVGDVVVYERDRKPVLFNPDSEEYLQPNSIDEVYSMLLSRLFSEQKVPLEVAAVESKLAAILDAEIPKLKKRQQEVLDIIAKEEAEQHAKLTSENICQEKFSSTRIAKKETGKQSGSSPSKKKETTMEVLNPNYHNVNGATKAKSGTADEFNLRDLSPEEDQILDEFATKKSFEDAYAFIQKHPELIAREFSDHLMAKAFKYQYDGEEKKAKNCAKMSLVLSYSLQMGPDGPRLFLKRMTQNGPEPIKIFEQDVEATYTRIRERCVVLRQKKESSEITEENSNLTPEQATAFKSFPKFFQDALMSNEMDKINEAFSKMDEATAKTVMDKCQETGLIAILSEEEAAKYMNESEYTISKPVA